MIIRFKNNAIYAIQKIHSLKDTKNKIIGTNAVRKKSQE